MLRIHLIFFALLAGAAAGEIRLTLESAPAYALRHNPTLAAVRLRIEEARGRLQQSGRLSNPELELDFTRNTKGREGSASITLMQRFPLTARLRHEKAVSRAELAAVEAEVRDAERKLAADVRIAAVKLLALREQRELRAQQLGNSRELSGFLLKRVETGESSLADAWQVELESRQIESENLMLAADEAVLLGELRPLIGVHGEDRILMTGGLPAPRGIPSAGEVLERPDILAAQFRAESARTAVLEQRARRWEDIGIGASYMRDRVMDEPEPMETEQIIGLRFTLPLPIWNRNSGRIQEAEAAAVRSAKEMDATRLTASAEAGAARAAMNAYARLLDDLDARVLPTATRIEEQLRQSYSTGQTPLPDVLRARTRRLELQGKRLDALRDYQLARIRHETASGRASLSRRSLEK